MRSVTDSTAENRDVVLGLRVGLDLWKTWPCPCPVLLLLVDRAVDISPTPDGPVVRLAAAGTVAGTVPTVVLGGGDCRCEPRP